MSEMRGLKFYNGEIALEVPESVYYPREDSLLLAKHLEKENLENKKCLDMGCGSGFFAIMMAKKGAIVTAVDINPGAAEAARKNAEENGVEADVFVSDVFSAVDGSYDFIAFNPPYLPVEDESEQWSGGASGREVIEKFLADLPEHLNNSGKVLMVFSSLTGESGVHDMAEKNGLSFRIVNREKISWEELVLAEIRHED